MVLCSFFAGLLAGAGCRGAAWGALGSQELGIAIRAPDPDRTFVFWAVGALPGWGPGLGFVWLYGPWGSLAYGLTIWLMS